MFGSKFGQNCFQKLSPSTPCRVQLLFSEVSPCLVLVLILIINLNFPTVRTSPSFFVQTDSSHFEAVKLLPRKVLDVFSRGDEQ